VDNHWKLAVKIIFLLLFVIFCLWFLQSISWVVGLLIISTVIVYILHPLVVVLKEKFKMKHGIATTLVFVLFLLFCVLVISLLVPVVYYELVELADSFPHYMNRFQEFLSWVSQQIVLLDLEEEVRNFLVTVSDNLSQAIEYLADASIYLIGGAVDFVLVLFLTFYLLYDFQEVRKQLLSIIPEAKKELAKRIVAIIDTNTGSYLRGSLIRCLIVGIVTGLVLFIIGMPYALLLGLIAGLFNFILYIGPYIAAIPALLLSFSPLTPSPLIIILIYVLIQALDGLFIAPVILGRSVQLKAITIITVILIGGSVGGLLGMVVAVPLAGIIKGILVLIKEGPAYTSTDLDHSS